MTITPAELTKISSHKLSIATTLAQFIDRYFASELEKYSVQDQRAIIYKLVTNLILAVVSARKKLEKNNGRSSAEEILFNLFGTVMNNRDGIAGQIPDVWLKMVKEKK